MRNAGGQAVRGLQVGESRRTRIEAERGYGERSDDMVVKIPRSRVPEGMEVVVGSKVPLSNGMMAVVLGADAEEIELDANHELAGKALTFDMELVGFEEGVLGEVGPGMERAVFGLGCFWGAELAFQRVAGVVATRVGYTHGQTEKPTYEQVCSGRTGHAEAVAVDFDPARVSFEQLVEVFWERLGQSAMTPNQVGNDVSERERATGEREGGRREGDVGIRLEKGSVLTCNVSVLFFVLFFLLVDCVFVFGWGVIRSGRSIAAGFMCRARSRNGWRKSRSERHGRGLGRIRWWRSRARKGCLFIWRRSTTSSTWRRGGRARPRTRPRRLDATGRQRQ